MVIIIDTLVNRIIRALGNGLLPVWHQAIIRTNSHLMSIGLLETKISEV